MGIAGQLSLSVATPSQHAAIAAFESPLSKPAVDGIMALYTERRDYMLGQFRKLGFKTYGGHGGCECN